MMEFNKLLDKIDKLLDYLTPDMFDDFYKLISDLITDYENGFTEKSLNEWYSDISFKYVIAAYILKK